MPPAAYAIVALFAIVSVLAGLLAAWIVGPRRPATALAPALGAFASLYLVGHRIGLSLGPTVPIAGFDIALPFDVAVALAAALSVAAIQSGVLRLLQPQERRARRDRLA